MSGNVRGRKSWIRRRRRRIKITLLILLCVILFAGIIVLINSMLPYEEADLSELYTIQYGGYNTNGTAQAVLNDEKVDELLTRLRDEHSSRLIDFNKPEAEDYLNFRNNLVATVTPSQGLANGSVVTLTVNYDKAAAKKLKLEVASVMCKTTVNGLERATVISEEQLFQDVEVRFSGISPTLTAEVVNNSENPFLKTVDYEIVEQKENYAEGEQVEVYAFYDEAVALKMQYVVDSLAQRSRFYTVSAEQMYVTDASDIKGTVLQTAIEEGKNKFNNANEYGVRIFCEGNLVPVYVNKQATFVWGEPKVLSAYFKSVHPSEAGVLGNNMNDLDVIYEVKLSQADGVSCTSYCAVRYSDFIKDANGNITYDYSKGKIVSASYYAERVKKNVVTAYQDSYNIEKVY